jgi:hypothetical protein
MRTALFREALALCKRYDLDPHYMQVSGNVLILLAKGADRAFAGRTGIVSVVSKDGVSAHVDVPVGNIAVSVVIPAGDLKPGDTATIPDSRREVVAGVGRVA